MVELIAKVQHIRHIFNNCFSYVPAWIQWCLWLKSRKICFSLIEKVSCFCSLFEQCMKLLSLLLEYYRKSFRMMWKGWVRTCPYFLHIFAFCLGLPFQRWLEWEGVLTDLSRVFEVFRLEKFVNCSPLETFQQITVKRPNALMKLTHEFAILYKPFPVKRFGQPIWHLAENGNWGKPKGHQMFLFWKFGIYKWVWISRYRCLLKKNGHIILSCILLKLREEHGRGNQQTKEKMAGKQTMGASACCPDLRVDAHCLPFCWIGVLFSFNCCC